MVDIQYIHRANWLCGLSVCFFFFYLSDIHAGGLVLLSPVLLSLGRRSQAEVALCFGLSTDICSGEGKKKMRGIEGKESMSFLSVQA